MLSHCLFLSRCNKKDFSKYIKVISNGNSINGYYASRRQAFDRQLKRNFVLDTPKISSEQKFSKNSVRSFTSGFDTIPDWAFYDGLHGSTMSPKIHFDSDPAALSNSSNVDPSSHSVWNLKIGGLKFSVEGM